MLSLTEVVDLRDPKMLRELLESGPQLWHTCIDSFPPAPARQATSGIINVGELVYEDLQREQLSLSSLNIGGNKVWQKEIYFWVDPSEELQAGDKLRLVAVDIYPPASNFRPEISLTHDQNTLERGIVLSVGETHSLQLGIIFPMKFKGSLNRVVSLDLMLQKNIGSFATKTIRYKVGFLLLGDVVSKTASHLQDAQLRPKIELSVEAPPFIPISNIIRFDQELSMPWTDPTALSQIMPKPHNFAKSLTIVDPFRFVSEELYRGYVEAFQQNRLPELVLRYGLNHLNQILANDSLLAVSTVEYMRTLGILAVLEEMQTRLDIAKFDLNFVPIKFAIESDSHFTILLKCKIHVPGSSESRPRVLIGDHIRIRPVKEDLATLHIPLFELIAVVTNYVLATEEATCLVSMQKFCPIEALENVRYDVRFSYDNSSFSFTHYLLQRNTVLSKHFLDAIFPTVALFDKLNQYRKLHPLRDHSMEKTASIRREYGSFNAEQERAIQNIVDWTDLEYPKGFKPPILPPFVIFGPPGTGKTRTVTESILRIIGEYPEKRILVCAPSDAAADVIAIRLCKSLGSDQLFRLNWWQRMLTSLPSMLLPYSYQAGDMFELPTTDILKKFQVVVSTCSSAGIFMSEWSRVDFDVVIVDEASQATESECIIPLSLCKEGGLMVLAGDIHQLRPTTKFPLFADCAPASSLQERLLKLPFYESCLPSSSKLLSTLPSNLVLGVFLSKNYRSHQSLLEVSSRLFYDGKLEPYADQQQVGRLLAWEKLKAKSASAPLLFCAVNGKHEHEMDSPSFFNKAEVSKVVEVCQSLVQSDLIPPSQIGVIAAFRKQVLKIRMGLREVGLAAINVGSVEDFQGQEVTAIVISTVLTSWVKRFASKGSFGFINDAKRFNVSVTRGMALCAVVGHPDFLYLDPYWKQMINHSIRYGCYDGDLPADLSTEEWNEDQEGHLFSTVIQSVMLELFPHEFMK